MATDLEADPLADLQALDASTERLLRTARGIGDHQLTAPSRCPGWTRAHVLAHLARNADALGHLAGWAASGVPAVMYESAESRTAGIDAGVGRTARELLDDLAAASAALSDALRGLPPEAWRRTVRGGPAASGPELLGAEIPFRRMTEVEVHHVDLDLTYTPAHWPAEFVTRLLDVTAARFAARDGVPAVEVLATDTERSWRWGGTGPLVHGPESALLGWLLGRTGGEGLTAEPAGLPVLPAWG